MNKRSLVKLLVIIAAVVLFGYVAVAGLSIGMYDIKPLGPEIKQGLDLTGGVSVVYQAKNLNDPDLAENIDVAITVFRTRLTSEGFPEATVTKQGTGRVRIEIPINKSNEVQDPNTITQYLVKTAKVEFVDPDGNVIIEGKDMKTVMPISNNSQYEVYFELESDAAAKFAEATTKFNGQAIAILMDGEVISAPVVNTPITGGVGQITGTFTLEEARLLAQQIRSGVMPIEMEELEVRSISATLGDQALEKGILAGIIGTALVMVFMIAIYRVPGVASVIALCIYLIIVMFALATMPGVQLTLPGIAGIILSVGMAVDANVIIFERFKEEIANGKTLRSASQAGFNRAFTAIMDSNVTTLIAAVVLMIFGTGPIKGFAVTLLIGVTTSFLTAVFISRGLLNLFIDLGLKNTALFTARKGGQAI